MIGGLSHITFIVSDLDKMEVILMKVLDAKKIYDSGDRTYSLSKERFCNIGGIWVATMEGEPLLNKTYNHVAFKMAVDDYENKLQRIQALALDVREGRSRVDGEGRSIYFYDFDNHMFELHSGTLQDRLRCYDKA
jgi:fosfomycin resistance protein FosX